MIRTETSGITSNPEIENTYRNLVYSKGGNSNAWGKDEPINVSHLENNKARYMKLNYRWNKKLIKYWKATKCVFYALRVEKVFLNMRYKAAVFSSLATENS